MTKTIDIEITGVAPLLQHRFAMEEHGENKSKAKTKVYDPKTEAEKCLYKNKAGEIFKPSEHVYQSMVRATVDFKFEGKKTYKDVITSGIIVEPEEIPLIVTNPYEIDARGAVVQGARIVRWRPKFNEWKLKFSITILDDENISVPVVKDILEKVGATKGIGDYRPRYGRFMVTAFQET